MATNSNWTVIFDDKKVIKNNGAEAGTGYVIDDSSFLSVLQSEWDSDVIYTYNEDGTIASTESESDQISRKGSRPTSYTSS